MNQVLQPTCTSLLLGLVCCCTCEEAGADKVLQPTEPRRLQTLLQLPVAPAAGYGNLAAQPGAGHRQAERWRRDYGRLMGKAGAALQQAQAASVYQGRSSCLHQRTEKRAAQRSPVQPFQRAACAQRVCPCEAYRPHVGPAATVRSGLGTPFPAASGRLASSSRLTGRGGLGAALTCINARTPPYAGLQARCCSCYI